MADTPPEQPRKRFSHRTTRRTMLLGFIGGVVGADYLFDKFRGKFPSWIKKPDFPDLPDFSRPDTREKIDRVIESGPRVEVTQANRDTILKPKPAHMERVRTSPEFPPKVISGTVSLPGKMKLQGIHHATRQEMAIHPFITSIRPVINIVEQKYGLPTDLITMLVMHESNAGTAMLNRHSDGVSSDGGAGYAHIQPDEAWEFGIDVLGHKAGVLPKPKNDDPEMGKKLVKGVYGGGGYPYEDERLDLLKSLDLVGRMLAYDFCRRIENDSWGPTRAYAEKFPALKSINNIEQALARYCGMHKYTEKFFNGEESYKDKLMERYRQFQKGRVGADRYFEDWFKIHNAGVTYKGQPLTYQKYIELYQQYYLGSYDLENYSKQKFKPTAPSTDGAHGTMPKTVAEIFR